MLDYLKLYARMFKSKGFYLPYKYFLENHLFDIKRNINTHIIVEKKDFNKNLPNLDHGIHYACSWESIILESLTLSLNHIGKDLSNFLFYDIGCGKGKVLIVWKEFLLKKKLNNDLYGIDYSLELIELAKQNYNKTFKENGNFICSDISKVNFSKGGKYLFYLYNPFDEQILQIFLNKIKNSKFLLIYNVPVFHDNILKLKKINLIHQNLGRHPNESFNIYKNF